MELWTEHHNAGPHIDASGKGCADIAAGAVKHAPDWTWQQHVQWLIERGAKLSRLDVAVDVVGGSLDVQAMVDAVQAGRITSRWSDASWQQMKGVGVGGRGGNTLYGGSPRSATRLCVYDKAAEQGWEPERGAWTRVEFRARHEAAVALGKGLAEGGMEKVMGVIAGYADFQGPDGLTLPAWTDALHRAAKSPLSSKQRGGTYESMAAWLEGDVAGPLAALLDANGGDWGKLEALVAEGRKRYSPKHRSIIKNRQDQLTREYQERTKP